MTHDTNFVTELRNAFANLISLITGRVTALEQDIDANVQVIANAYHEIKADRAEISEISAVTSGFAHDLLNANEDTANVQSDADTVVSDMYDLVADGYIDDDEVLVPDEDYDLDECEEDEDEDEGDLDTDLSDEG